MVKPHRAQQASEGIVVASSRATNNARGAKGPCGGHVEGARTRKGMAGKTGPNHPDHRTVIGVMGTGPAGHALMRACALDVTTAGTLRSDRVVRRGPLRYYDPLGHPLRTPQIGRAHV